LSRRKQRGPAPASAAPPSAKHETAAAQPSSPGATGAGKGHAEGDVKVGGWVSAESRITRKTFPDPGATGEPVRIAMSGRASAEMVGHAKESLDAEVCGVLVGQLCEDDEGLWVSVQGAIRGASTKKGGAHVTYTQETWRNIHEVKDRDYPASSIVGWYHSHPGFGVEFSAMDTFIQENFFAGPRQFAMVMDPLSGDEAICVNGPDGICHVSRFWIDGRPRNCRLPRSGEAASGSGPGTAAEDLARRLAALEHRLAQALQAADEERAHRHLIRLGVGMLLGAAIVTWILFMVYNQLFPRQSPPERVTWAKLPVRIGDKNALVGVQVVSWDLPAEWHAAFVQHIKDEIEAEAKKQRAEEDEKAQAESGSQPPTPAHADERSKPPQAAPEGGRKP